VQGQDQEPRARLLGTAQEIPFEYLAIVYELWQSLHLPVSAFIGSVEDATGAVIAENEAVLFGNEAHYL
jgi:hypothetical protein